MTYLINVNASTQMMTTEDYHEYLELRKRHTMSLKKRAQILIENKPSYAQMRRWVASLNLPEGEKANLWSHIYWLEDGYQAGHGHSMEGFVEEVAGVGNRLFEVAKAKRMAVKLDMAYWPALINLSINPSAMKIAEEILTQTSGGHLWGEYDPETGRMFHGGWDSMGHHGLSADTVAQMWYAAGCGRNLMKFKSQVYTGKIAGKRESDSQFLKRIETEEWLELHFRGADFTHRAVKALGRISKFARRIVIGVPEEHEYMYNYHNLDWEALSVYQKGDLEDKFNICRLKGVYQRAMFRELFDTDMRAAGTWELVEKMARKTDIRRLQVPIRGPEVEEDWEDLIRKVAEWERVFKRIPKNKGIIEAVDLDTIGALKPGWKYFMRGCGVTGVKSHPHAIAALANMVSCFGKETHKLVPHWQDHIAVHDMGIDCPTSVPNEECLNFLLKYLKQNRFKEACKAIKTYKDWDHFGVSLKTSLSEITARVKYTYEGCVNWSLAAECSKWDIQPDEFPRLQAAWLQLKTFESIPQVEVPVEDGYRIYKLDHDDPRGIFAGEHTDCCQHPGGVGESCALYGHQSGNSCFIVLEKRGQIVAQSWTWRNGDIVVLDNIEALGDGRGAIARRLFQKFAEGLVGVLGISEVHLGTGLSDLTFGDPCTSTQVPPDYDGYTDAGHQRRIA